MSIKVIDYAAVKEVEKLNDKVCDCLNYQEDYLKWMSQIDPSQFQAHVLN
jgi:hypothetical protein